MRYITLTTLALFGYVHAMETTKNESLAKLKANIEKQMTWSTDETVKHSRATTANLPELSSIRLPEGMRAEFNQFFERDHNAKELTLLHRLDGAIIQGRSITLAASETTLLKSWPQALQEFARMYEKLGQNKLLSKIMAKL